MGAHIQVCACHDDVPCQTGIYGCLDADSTLTVVREPTVDAFKRRSAIFDPSDSPRCFRDSPPRPLSSDEKRLMGTNFGRLLDGTGAGAEKLLPNKSIFAESPRGLFELSRDDSPWSVGNRCVVVERPCVLLDAPRADAGLQGVLKPRMMVVLLKLVKEEGLLWALVDPPLRKFSSAGWALLEGEAQGCEESRLKLWNMDLGWEVGGAYALCCAATLVAAAEFSSEKVCSLKEDDKVEVLDLQLLGEEKPRPQLRAKVLVWRSREVGWLSPRRDDGTLLLKPFVARQTLEASGRALTGGCF